MKKIIKTWMVMLLVLGLSFSASAATLTYDLNVVFSGSAPSSSTLPWLTATFEDVSGGVQLTLAAPNLSTGEFVSEWSFNVNPAITNLDWTPKAPTTVAGVTIDAVNFGQNSYKANGDGWFDLQFVFPTANVDGRFTDNESIVFLLTGTDLVVSDFLFMSSSNNQIPGNQSGLLYTAAHVQGINNDPNSGWITTPVPAAAWLLGSGLLGLIAIRRRVKK